MRQFLHLTELWKSLDVSGCPFFPIGKHCLLVSGVNQTLRQILLPITSCRHPSQKHGELLCRSLHKHSYIIVLLLIPEEGCLKFSQLNLNSGTSYSVIERKRDCDNVFFLGSPCQPLSIFILFTFIFSTEGDKTSSRGKNILESPSFLFRVKDIYLLLLRFSWQSCVLSGFHDFLARTSKFEKECL